ncbi:MAG: Hsp70 family protein [Acidobacteriota bacterium]|nr:Hsp70 family protein [Acidobacteriota bacterium]
MAPKTTASKPAEVSIAQSTPCATCGEWLVRPEDNYCCACGQLQLALEIKPASLVFLASLARARQKQLLLFNREDRTLQIEVRSSRVSWIRIQPEKLTIAAGDKGCIQLQVLPDRLPKGGQDQHLDCRLVVDEDPRRFLPFPVSVKAGPKPIVAPVQFGELREGGVEHRELILRNDGAMPLSVQQISAEGSSQLVLGAVELPARIGPKSAMTFPVSWDTNQPDPGDSKAAGFRLLFSNHDELFVPARVSLYRYRLVASPKRIRLEGSSRDRHRAEIELRNQGTVDIEVEDIHTEQPWIHVPKLETSVSLAAPDKRSASGGGQEKTADSILPLEVVCSAEELTPGAHEGSVDVKVQGEQENLQIPIEVQVFELQKYTEYIGIDFGTTNSVVSVFDPHSDSAVLVEVENENQEPSPLIPSVLTFTGPDGSHLIGYEARSEIRVSEGPTVRSVKRIMGYDEGWLAFDRVYQPEELAALILRQLTALASKKLQELTGSYFDIRRAIVTVPADFYGPQIQSILRACELAGLEAENNLDETVARELRDQLGNEVSEGMILDEPSAAALYFLHYLADHRSLHSDLEELIARDQGMHLLVFDYGGGTLDISIAQVAALQDDSIGLSVLANFGDNRLGGDHLDILLIRDFLAQASLAFEDFDDSLIRANHAQIEKRRASENWPNQVWDQIERARRTWKDAAEKLKIALADPTLGNDDPITVELPPEALCHLRGNELVSTSEPLLITRTRNQLEERLHEALEGIRPLLEKTLHLAELTPDQIDFVFHAGRQSFMPAVRERVAQLFPQAHEANRIVLDESLLKVCVAKGAALYGRLRDQPEGSGKIRLIQKRRLPHSYGVARHMGFGRFELEEIIAQGETYPVEKTKRYKRQEIPKSGRLRVQLYQNGGLSSQIKNNPEIRKLGELEQEVSTDRKDPLDLRLAVDINRRLLVHLDGEPVELRPLQVTDDMDWMG